MHDEYLDVKMDNQTNYATVSANLYIFMAWVDKQTMFPAAEGILRGLCDGINCLGNLQGIEVLLLNSILQ